MDLNWPWKILEHCSSIRLVRLEMWPLIRHFGRASLRLFHAAGSHRCENTIIWFISSCSVVEYKPTWHIPWLSVAPGHWPERKTMSCTFPITVSYWYICILFLTTLYWCLMFRNGNFDELEDSILAQMECWIWGIYCLLLEEMLFEWWPTQLSWNINDENFVPKPLTCH